MLDIQIDAEELVKEYSSSLIVTACLLFKLTNLITYLKGGTLKEQKKSLAIQGSLCCSG